MRYGCVKAGIILSFLAILAACVTYEDRYARNDGWRRGHITAVDTYSKLSPVPRDDCVKETSATSDSQVAIVSYKSSSRYNKRVVILPPDSSFKPGDMVYINVFDCSQGLKPRTNP
jgi:hypothetical protein